MTFQPGREKTGGRTKGTPNKTSASLHEKCLAVGVDPWGEMLKIAKDPAHPDRFQALKELLPYLYPKRKALEVSPEGFEEELSKLPETELLGRVRQAIAVIESARGSKQ